MESPSSSPPPPARHRLPGAVIWFGIVSFLTDASSEMIYPLLPRFLTEVLGAGTIFVGAVEGVAEATASLFKLISGRIADASPKKKPLTILGYGVSSLMRPLVGLATAPWMVLGIRFADRVGKGIRSSPRDAIVADVTPPERRGAAFGYHRAMDNGGAVLGPLLGAALVTGLGLSLRATFLWAAAPAALAMAALLFGVREPAHTPAPKSSTSATPAASHDSPALAPYLASVALFTLGNSSDAFLLLRAADVGIGAAQTLLLWTMHNGMKSLLNRSFGALSDRVGRKRLIGAGWLVYSATYLGFAIATTKTQIWLLFALYGVYYALVEGSERALVADLAGPGRRGRAFGWFHTITGLLALPASIGFGLVYRRWGALTAFGASAGLAMLALLFLVAFVRTPRRP